MPNDPPLINARRALPAEMIPALRQVLAAEGELADDGQARDLVRVAGERNIDLTELWLVPSPRGVVWSLLPVSSPGRTVLFFLAPAFLLGDQTDIAAAAIRQACAQFAARNVQLAQALVTPDDPETVAMAESAGFTRMATLMYMQRTVRRASPPPPLPGQFLLHNYAPATHAGFAAAIRASYQQSLDCPGLNGVRSIEDVLDGHRAAGIFDPADWFLVTHAGEPVAVLLLNQAHGNQGLELVYLGLAPHVRGHGLANYLLNLAAARASRRKLKKISLAVDTINAPAIKLYCRHGFEKVSDRVALMRACAETDPRTKEGREVSGGPE